MDPSKWVMRPFALTCIAAVGLFVWGVEAATFEGQLTEASKREVACYGTQLSSEKSYFLYLELNCDGVAGETASGKVLRAFIQNPKASIKCQVTRKGVGDCT